MSDATYGELLDIGERFLIEAALSSRDKLPNAPAAAAAAEAHAKLIKALRANLRIFTELPSVDVKKREHAVSDAVTQLAHALDAFIDSSSLMARPQLNERSDANNWISAARALHVAADTLRTHLGPERAHRTPDATVLDDPRARQAVVRRLAEMTLTVSEAQRRLSLRIRETAATRPDTMALRAAAGLMLDTHASLSVAAASVITSYARTPIPHALRALPPAPLLRPTRAADPAAAAWRSFHRIRLIAHRQVRGELPAGIDAVRAYATTVAIVTMHAHAVFAAASIAGVEASEPRAQERLVVAAATLHDASKPWHVLATSTESYASIRRSPKLLSHEVNVLAENLAGLTRTADRWRGPHELLPDGRTERRLLSMTRGIISGLPDIVQASTALTVQLLSAGDVLMPTRERDDVDFPFRWCPATEERAAHLRSSVKHAAASSHRLAPTYGTESALCSRIVSVTVSQEQWTASRASTVARSLTSNVS